MSSVAVGDILLGAITRLEKYGAFCRLEGKNLTGLVHISELGEEYVKTVSSVVGVGDTVRVAVTKVDEAKNRVYLSMKGLGKVEAEEESDEEEGEELKKEEEPSRKEVGGGVGVGGGRGVGGVGGGRGVGGGGGEGKESGREERRRKE